jgi:O-antigen ligase
VSVLILFGAVSIAWAGADAIATRLSTWQDDSLYGRVAVWRDARTLVRQFPLTGTGLNTFGVAMLFYQTTHLQELYAEAHNDYLQVAAEGGALIGIPALALIVVTWAEVRRRLRGLPRGSSAHWIRAGAITGLLAACLQDAGEFSLQMPGNAALFCVLAAIALSRSTDAPCPA